MFAIMEVGMLENAAALLHTPGQIADSHRELISSFTS
jgi:hypothetical protein